MKSLFRTYPYFFTGYMLFVLTGMTFLLINSDHHSLELFSEYRMEGWNHFFWIFDRVGEEWGYFLVAAILLVQYPARTIGLAATAILSTIFAQGLKFAFGNPRPSVLYGAEISQFQPMESWEIVTGHNSFPSGHATSAFALVTFVLICWRAQPTLQIILLITGGLAALARVYFLNHFLSDVIAGSAIGMIAGITAGVLQQELLSDHWKFYRFPIFRKPTKSRPKRE